MSTPEHVQLFASPNSAESTSSVHQACAHSPVAVDAKNFIVATELAVSQRYLQTSKGAHSPSRRFKLGL